MEFVFFLREVNFLFDCIEDVLISSAFDEDADTACEDEVGFGEGHPSLVYAVLILSGSLSRASCILTALQRS